MWLGFFCTWKQRLKAFESFKALPVAAGLRRTRRNPLSRDLFDSKRRCDLWMCLMFFFDLQRVAVHLHIWLHDLFELMQDWYRSFLMMIYVWTDEKHLQVFCSVGHTHLFVGFLANWLARFQYAIFRCWFWSTSGIHGSTSEIQQSSKLLLSWRHLVWKKGSGMTSTSEPNIFFGPSFLFMFEFLHHLGCRRTGARF